MKNLTFLLVLVSSYFYAQINSAKVYWVGHSLISSTYSQDSNTVNLIQLMNTLASSQNKTYNYHKHTTPGAPIGWNWGANPNAWNDIEDLIQPLINTSHGEYGTFDVMVVTEGIDVTSSFQWWKSSFYARKFYNAAKNANPNTRLFLYESWHHFNASDDNFRSIYGPMEDFNWDTYMTSVRPTWNTILDYASNPSLTQDAPDYTYQGPGEDPGLGDGLLEICLIPTGEVFQSVLDRLNQNLATDDWSYNGGNLNPKDFFENPLDNFPSDLTTRVDPSRPLDDIHPSNVLIYLNALVHYAVIYQDNPINLPASNNVPSNIADIFKDVVWNIVNSNTRTCMPTLGTSENILSKIKLYPNPTTKTVYLSNLEETINYTVTNVVNKIIKKGTLSPSKNSIDVSALQSGFYIIKTKDVNFKLIKN